MNHEQQREQLNNIILDRYVDKIKLLQFERDEYLKKLVEIKDDLKTAKMALNYYAKGETKGMVAGINERSEFGCGCCSGIGKINGFEHDRDVVGLTAREALENIKN